MHILFLKATHKKNTWIPQYTKRDGTVVEGHYQAVHVSDDHDPEKVASGQGTSSQKLAHKKLSKHSWFQSLPTEHKAAHVLSEATKFQDAKSAASDIATFKKKIKAGIKPAAKEWAAAMSLGPAKNHQLVSEISVAGKLSFFQEEKERYYQGIAKEKPDAKKEEPKAKDQEKEVPAERDRNERMEISHWKLGEEISLGLHGYPKVATSAQIEASAEKFGVSAKDAAKALNLYTYVDSENDAAKEMIAVKKSAVAPGKPEEQKERAEGEDQASKDAQYVKDALAGGWVGAWQHKAAVELSRKGSWQLATTTEQVKQIKELAKEIQGGASDTAKVAKFKEFLLNGKVPTKAQTEAFKKLQAAEKTKIVMEALKKFPQEKVKEMLSEANKQVGAKKEEPAEKKASKSVTLGDADGLLFRFVQDGATVKKFKTIPGEREVLVHVYNEASEEAASKLYDSLKEKFIESVFEEVGEKKDDGPKDGDTKSGADGMLVFHNGRWHKQGGAEDKPESIKLETEDGYIHLDVKENSIQIVMKHDKYDPEHKHETKFESHEEAVKHFGEMKEHYLKKGYKEKVEKKVEEQKTPSKAVAEDFSRPIISVDISGWKQTGEMLGTQPGGTFEDEKGDKWYVKFVKSESHVKNELLAAKLYASAGVAVPFTQMVYNKGTIGIASKIIPGLYASPAMLKKDSDGGMSGGFAADAWLANWDTVGPKYGNMQIGPDGKIYRIDFGGALNYSGLGSPKGSKFGDTVGEIKTLRDKKLNPEAGEIFSTLSDESIKASVAKVLAIPNNTIKGFVFKYGPGNNLEKQILYAKLLMRKEDMQKQFPSINKEKAKLDPEHLPVNVSMLPDKPNFLDWKKSGKGLSATQKVNEVNQAAVDEIEAAALNGNLIAIKTLKIHFVDKKTGETKMVPVSEIPSQWVKNYHSDVVLYMDSILNPSAKEAKRWDEKIITSIKDLAAKFKPHLYGIGIGHVRANIRLGFWISLGTAAHGGISAVPSKQFTATATDQARGKEAVHDLPSSLKKWMAAVKGSGNNNQPYRDGAEKDYQGQSCRQIVEEAYQHAVEFAEGTVIRKGINMDKKMIQLMHDHPVGHVFQNPGSMCTSLVKDWSWNGDALLEIVYAKGAKALYNIGVGSHNDEGELTTLPGQRFMILEQKKTPSKSHKHYFKLLMLPPDENYVDQVWNKQATEDEKATLL